MTFTPQEMELVCFFHAGTRSKTLEALRGCAAEVRHQSKQDAALSAAEKLSALPPGDPVALAFDGE